MRGSAGAWQGAETAMAAGLPQSKVLRTRRSADAV